MKFKYTPEQLSKVIEHEEHMLTVYNQLLEKYKDAFAKYQCSLKVEMYWRDEHLKQESDHRIPLKYGYTCYVVVGAQKDGEFVKIESDDGEVDWYWLWTSSEVTRISWTLFYREFFCFPLQMMLRRNYRIFWNCWKKIPEK